MEKKEVDKILSYLQAAFPNDNWRDTNKAKEIRTVWQEILKTFPYPIAQEAAKAYIFIGGKFFPSIGEFVKLCDECWQRDEEKKRLEQSQNEIDAVKLLFHNPTESIKDSHVRKSVELIRDVTSGKLKYLSQEWIDRFNDIYGGEYDPQTGRDFIL